MMPVPWKLWEGQVVDLSFPLRRYLGGTARSAMYLTQYGDPEPCNAAIKLVLADEAQESALALEWERAAQLSHPNLLRLFRTGTWQVNHQSLRYAVTEYAEENLAEVLAERPLTAAETREMLRPLLEALAYIHGEGLVHGHLKPANIMAIGDQLRLSVDGLSLVGESGMAPAIPSPYDPPELPERGSSPVGDVWSFGVTLVEALTQQLPVVYGARQEPELPKALPAEFLPMVRACLRPDPRRRASLYDILAQFERAGPEAIEEPSADLPASPRKWLSLAVVGASALAVAAILAAPRLRHQPAAPAPAERPVVSPVSRPASAVPESAQAAEPAPEAAETPEVAAPATPAPEPDAAPGQVIHQVMPEVLQQARRTIRGTVKIEVRARVDGAGHVTTATVESQNSRYFANLAVEAARRWDFAPEAAGEWLLRFEFTTAGDTVHPSRVAP